MKSIKFILVLVLGVFLSACGTNPAKPEVIFKTKTKAVTLPSTYYVIADVPSPAAAPVEYQAMVPEKREIALEKTIQSLYEHIRILRTRIASIQTASEQMKQTIEEKKDE